MNDVVVTACGLITPLGDHLTDFSRRMFNAESGITPLGGAFKDAHFPVHCAGRLSADEFPPLQENLYFLETEVILQKMFDGYFREGHTWQDVDGLIYGTNNGTPRFHDIKKISEGSESVNVSNLQPEHGLNFLLKYLTEKGQSPLAPQQTMICVNNCVTGLQSVSYAAQRIKMGMNQRMLVVCDEPRIRAEDLLKYNALGALSRDAGPASQVSRPFTKSRSGFVKSEGAGFLVLENKTLAEKSPGKIWGQVLGFGQTADAWRMTDGREDIKGMKSAMEKALQQAGLRPDQISYINAHGSSTQQNDYLETKGIKEVFGPKAYNIPVSSLKSQIGHLNYSCGIVETIACLVMLQQQTVAPTINYKDPDPLCDLYYVPNRSETASIQYVLKNSFGFGGANASLVLGRI